MNWLLTQLSTFNSQPVSWRVIRGFIGLGLAWVLAATGADGGFSLLPPDETGLRFQHAIPTQRHSTNQMLLDGSGVALGDVTGDGMVDVFLGGSGGQSQLWRNLGQWKFENITPSAFADHLSALAGDVTGVALADVTGDGALDLFLNTHAEGMRFLINDGQGRFRLQPFPVSRHRGGHSLALADVDGDGWVDLYVCNYRRRALMDMPSARATFQGSGADRRVATLDGRPTTDADLTNRFVVNAAGGLEELGEPDVLYRNLGGTNFAELSWQDGSFLTEDGKPLADSPRDWGLAAQFCDVNGDGRPDLYVCNDFQSPDRLWLNESTPGKVRMRLVPADRLRQTSLFSMGVDFGDVNRDGRPDFVVLDMLSPDPVRRMTMLDGTPSVTVDPEDPRSRPQVDANTLFLQRADGSFAQIANFAGVMATDWSWTPAFLDVDLDGWLDLLVTAGQERGSRDLDIAEHMKAFRRGGLRTDAQIFRERLKFPPQSAPLKAFRNSGGAIPVFEDRSREWQFDQVGVSHGMALGDLDGDGDQDVVINRLNASAAVFRNEAKAPRLAVRLKGRAPNRQALGAKLNFRWPSEANPTSPPQFAQIFAGGRYLSSDAFTKTFACPGPGTGELDVWWPSGRSSRSSGLTAGQTVELEEPMEPTPAPVPERAEVGVLGFRETPSGISGGSVPGPDWSGQPLLPRRQNTRLPALAWSSADSALWVALGPGQPLRPYSWTSKGFQAGPPRESAAVAVAVAGSDVWWLEPAKTGVVLRSGSPGTTPSSAIPTQVSTASGMSAASVAGQPGALVWIAGGTVPGRYPESASSELFRRTAQGLRSVGVTNLGLVTGSVWVDLDGDSQNEWVTVSEWGTPRAFRTTPAGFEGVSQQVSFPDGSTKRWEEFTGWWQSVVAGDFDQDGRMDLVLGNWGLNSPNALLTGPVAVQGAGRPLHLWSGEALEAGPGGCLEGYTDDQGRLRTSRSLSDLETRIPWLRSRFATHRSFAEATVPEILGTRATELRHHEARWLSSWVLWNRGSRFEAQLLPAEAQLGPWMAAVTGDFDGDGRLDVYGAQGFFGHNFGLGREDAGEGVFLLSRPGGAWEAIPTAATGIRILGQQRSAVAPDLNGDGRSDLIVGEWGGSVRVFLSDAQKP